MAIVPVGVWMNQENVPPLTRTGSFSSSSLSSAALLRGWKSPATALRNGLSPIKAAHPDAANFSLQLTKVLGTTTSSVTGFASLNNCFATVAGSTAVVSYIDDDYNISQRFFRVRPSAVLPGQSITSPTTAEAAPVTPDQPRYRNLASVRASILGSRTPNSTAGSDVGVSPAKVVARQRTRSAACVALSPNGRLLAIGESGYSPRILLFSLASNGFEAPIATLFDHTSGIKCIKFSPDGRWMCSVGDIYDGYIHLWSINHRTGIPRLHSTNKCTSAINDMIFLSNSTIITVGTRHVRLWRNEEKKPPSPNKAKLRLDIGTPSAPSSPGLAKALAGRNCLLGSLLEAKSFTSVHAYSETRALISSDRGDLCLLDDSEGSQKLQCVRRFSFGIRCLAIDFSAESVWVGGDSAELMSLPLSQILNSGRPVSPTKESSNSGEETATVPKALCSSALGIVRGRIVLVDSDRSIKLFKATDAEKVDITNADSTAPSHSSPVLGINVRYDEAGEVAGFITWEASGSVLFWNKNYEHERTSIVPLDPGLVNGEEGSNELKVMLPLAGGRKFVSGDKRGTLRLFDGANWENAQTTNAHAGEITDIVHSQVDGAELIVSSGRDRMIQVFELQANSLNLIQTLESHGSSVNELLSIDKGRLILSSSSDRTIMISALASTVESRAYVPIRTVTLKATPASVTLSSEDSNDVIVTTLDKQLIRFNIVEGQDSRSANDSLRLTDIEESETVLVTSACTRTVQAGAGPSQLLFGVSSTDKSLRVHNANTGSTLLKDFGHSEGISSMIILEESHEDGNSWYSIVSTGVDGTIMRWELSNVSSPPGTGQASIPNSPATETPPPVQPPLRRVLSRSALAEYSKVLEAEGNYPLPSLPSRGPSPNRLRKRYSTMSIGSGSGRARHSRPSILPGQNTFLNRSPSPTSPADITPTQPRVRPSLPDRGKTKSTNALNDTLHQNTEQISKTLRTFRKKLNTTSSMLKPEIALELEKELIATVNVLTQRSRSQRTASGNNVGDLLDQYSEKVARLKERARSRQSIAGPGGLPSPVNGTATLRRIRERPTLTSQVPEETHCKDDSL